MESSKLRGARQQALDEQDDRQQQGFALVSLIVLVPLVLALISALVYSHIALQRKSLAQSLCVHEATRMQMELGQTLEKLLRLNKRATRLRLERQKAETSLEAAIASEFPPAIAAAEAVRIAVIVAQTELQAEQQILLFDAERTRLNHERELRTRVLVLQASGLNSHRFYSRALAVQAVPLQSLSPDYVTVQPFRTLQRHDFDYAVSLQPFTHDVQRTECSVSLKNEGNKWNPDILAASAPSRPR